MTQSQILEQLKSGKLSVQEASSLLSENTPTVRIVATQFRDSGEFLSAAQPLTVDGNGLSVKLSPKVFSTGSYGWTSCGKQAVRLADGRDVRVQCSVNLIVIGSKPSA